MEEPQWSSDAFTHAALSSKLIAARSSNVRASGILPAFSASGEAPSSAARAPSEAVRSTISAPRRTSSAERARQGMGRELFSRSPHAGHWNRGLEVRLPPSRPNAHHGLIRVRKGTQLLLRPSRNLQNSSKYALKPPRLSVHRAMSSVALSRSTKPLFR